MSDISKSSGLGLAQYSTALLSLQGTETLCVAVTGTVTEQRTSPTAVLLQIGDASSLAAMLTLSHTY